MNKIAQFLQTRWGAVVMWVAVMYVTAGLWNVIDDDSWYAFPSYVISVLAWIGSFVYMLLSFLEWSEGTIRFKRVVPTRPTPPAPTESGPMETFED